MSSSPVPLKTHRVGKRRTLNLSRAQTSSRWCVGACSGVQLWSPVLQDILPGHPTRHPLRRRHVMLRGYGSMGCGFYPSDKRHDIDDFG
ncbi:hypothetical protein TNCV_1033251 [Trichonephila clavipes]|nr:hypothetical protein TNCV_1033251 [Trichonephila clavipes]